MSSAPPPEVDALYKGVAQLLDQRDSTGRKVGNCTRGVYLFIDYDGEPIYVGQTTETLRTRIRRHLTNQRTDAVAMRVLDPFEVAEIEMWPFWELEDKPAGDLLDRAEYTVYTRALASSEFAAVLNEGKNPATDLIEMPPSVRGSILPDSQRETREHPDLRLARRARTIADLARVISERRVKIGIRQTLWVQSRRLEHLAGQRLEELTADDDPSVPNPS